jgi:hypothetical protein
MDSAHSLINDLFAVWQLVPNENFINYIMNSLHVAHNPFVLNFSCASRTGSLSFAKFQAKLLSFVHLQHAQQEVQPNNSMAFMSNKSPSSSFPKKHHPPLCTNYSQKPNYHASPGPRGSTPQPMSTTPLSRPPCQICGKTSHQAPDCFHHMDYAYQGRHPPAQLVAMAAHTTNQPNDDSPCLVDNAANLHFTLALEKLQFTKPYAGSGAIVVRNSSGLQIMNIGSLFFSNS